MTERCDLTELPVEQCACRMHAPQPSVGVRVVEHAPPGWLVARYAGQCAVCGEPFSEGALIRRDEDTGRWMAECCSGEDGAS